MDAENKTLTLDKSNPETAAAVEGLVEGSTVTATVVKNDETACVLELQPAAEESAEPAGAPDESAEAAGDMPSAVSAMIGKKRKQ